MGLRDKQQKFWIMVSKLILFAEEQGTVIVPLEWMRTYDEQKEKVEAGASKTMLSKHLTGLAIDACFLADLHDDKVLNYVGEKYRALGEYWESLGGRWGGRFGVQPENYDKEIGWDPGHFEYAGSD